MSGNIVKIETAMIGRLPQARSEIWEVGRRSLAISIAELERTGERPELLLAVQVSGRGGAILANLVPSSAPLATLADFVLQAMRQPMIGKPRRPQVIRVGSPVEAETLIEALSAVGVRLEVSPALAMLDALLEELGASLGGGDYRTQAARAGESLSDEGLRELFRAAAERRTAAAGARGEPTETPARQQICLSPRHTSWRGRHEGRHRQRLARCGCRHTRHPRLGSVHQRDGGR